MHETNLNIIRAVDTWAKSGGRTSYQVIAEKTDSGNLFGINGDEDNPKK